MLEQGEESSTVEQSTQIGATEIFEMSTILRFMLMSAEKNKTKWLWYAAHAVLDSAGGQEDFKDKI